MRGAKHAPSRAAGHPNGVTEARRLRLRETHANATRAVGHAAPSAKSRVARAASGATLRSPRGRRGARTVRCCSPASARAAGAGAGRGASPGAGVMPSSGTSDRTNAASCSPVRGANAVFVAAIGFEFPVIPPGGPPNFRARDARRRWARPRMPDRVTALKIVETAAHRAMFERAVLPAHLAPAGDRSAALKTRSSPSDSFPYRAWSRVSTNPLPPQPIRPRPIPGGGIGDGDGAPPLSPRLRARVVAATSEITSSPSRRQIVQIVSAGMGHGSHEPASHAYSVTMAFAFFSRVRSKRAA